MKTKITKTKQEFCWHLADIYIQLFKVLKGYKQDEAFRKMVDGLQKYIIDKLELENDGEIIETYITVVQEAE